MRFWIVPALLVCLLLTFVAPCFAQDSTQKDSSGSSSSRSKKSPKSAKDSSGLEDGIVSGGAYRNSSLGLTCKIPAGWVLRTEEMNAQEEDKNPSPEGTQGSPGKSDSGRVLLAAFSRPPQAAGDDINASIVIAAEPVTAYPGLTEAVQYLDIVTEVPKAQGFEADEDPYELAIGPKTLVRADLHRDVGSRVMQQSTMVFLAKGHAVSITVIGGTEDEVEGLVDGLSFSAK